MQPGHIFTVSVLNGEVRQVLERGFGSVWLMGEISNFAAPSSGHWYFTLKDERAQIRAAMFRNANQSVRLRPQQGLQVLVRAKITVYEPRGDYQLIVEHMEDAGAGLLQQQYEQLKRKLQAAGLFDADTKQPLPEQIRKVGVVTSPTGAAVRDILAVLKRRDPSVEVIIYPAQVQGQAATESLLFALQRACERDEVDVLIVSRGGGSLEDLWCFNDERFAYALHSCPIPTISAVGHEVDFTIADYVADVRAPTPSAAAELVSRDRRENVQQLTHLSHRLSHWWRRYAQQQKQDYLHLQQRLAQQDPKRQLQQNSQRIDELTARVEQAINAKLRQHKQLQAYLAERLQREHPQFLVQQQQQTLSQLHQRIARSAKSWLQQQQQRQHAVLQAVHMVSPLQTIERGYAVVRNRAGQVIRAPEQLEQGESFRVKVAKGEFTAQKS